MSSQTRTRISFDGHSVTLRYYDEDEERVVERQFYAPLRGGYVRERARNGSDPQVCRELCSMGETLEISANESLLNLIRREWRARRASERRARGD